VQVVLCVLLLTEMFDGDLDPEEFELWQMCVSLCLNTRSQTSQLTPSIEATYLPEAFMNGQI
jgi:hypothetical protein